MATCTALTEVVPCITEVQLISQRLGPVAEEFEEHTHLERNIAQARLHKLAQHIEAVKREHSQQTEARRTEVTPPSRQRAADQEQRSHLLELDKQLAAVVPSKLAVVQHEPSVAEQPKQQSKAGPSSESEQPQPEVVCSSQLVRQVPDTEQATVPLVSPEKPAAAVVSNKAEPPEAKTAQAVATELHTIAAEADKLAAAEERTIAVAGTQVAEPVAAHKQLAVGRHRRQAGLAWPRRAADRRVFQGRSCMTYLSKINN